MYEHLTQSDFQSIVVDALEPSLRELGFHLADMEFKTTWFHAEFLRGSIEISINYELPMHYAYIRLLTDPSGGLASLDDPTKTFSLDRVVEATMPELSPGEIQESADYFGSFDVSSSEASRLLQMVKTLRLVLPHWLRVQEA